MKKVKVAIVGSGNIGIDLMYKLQRSDVLELEWLIGIDPDSEGLAKAKALGIKTSAEGLEKVLETGMDVEIAFDATSAKAHIHHDRLLSAQGIQVIDLTPAAIGPYLIAGVNLDEHLDKKNINLVTCGGQATVPLVHAVSRVAHVNYAEIVATISSKSAGPGTRSNIDEFTVTTARAIEEVGGADKGKAIILLNPAEPPIMMRDTIYCQIADGNEAVYKEIDKSIKEMVEHVQTYVPGYRLLRDPIYKDNLVSISVEVEGLGDYLPVYSGNLDIMTASAVKVAEEFAKTTESIA